MLVILSPLQMILSAVELERSYCGGQVFQGSHITETAYWQAYSKPPLDTLSFLLWRITAQDSKKEEWLEAVYSTENTFIAYLLFCCLYLFCDLAHTLRMYLFTAKAVNIE